MLIWHGSVDVFSEEELARPYWRCRATNVFCCHDLSERDIAGILSWLRLNTMHGEWACFRIEYRHGARSITDLIVAFTVREDSDDFELGWRDCFQITADDYYSI